MDAHGCCGWLRSLEYKLIQITVGLLDGKPTVIYMSLKFKESFLSILYN